jgi:hypothetical protein
MKREPCPICNGKDIRYSIADKEYYCAGCNVWPSPMRDKYMAGLEWDNFARGPQ